MKSDFIKTPVGDTRPSQAIHTFGVGSLIDLPRMSAIVMGLDEWDDPLPERRLDEERLLGLIRSQLGDQVELLAVPPLRSESDGRPDPSDPAWRRGIPVSPFPRWVRCPNCALIAPLNSGLFLFRRDDWHPDRTGYIHANCAKTRGKPPFVLPVRFVVTCEGGHLDDFPWKEFVHRGPTSCRSVLRLYEFGVSAEAADITVKCDTCGDKQVMTTAFGEEGKKRLGACRGLHPHLRHRARKCDQPLRAILAGATNLWFPVTMSAISLPADEGLLDQRVREAWGILAEVTSREVLAFAMKQAALGTLKAYTEEQVWAAMERRRRSDTVPRLATVAELKAGEWAAFSEPPRAPSDRDFRLVEASLPEGWERYLERVVHVERLRVVQALTGFTRIVNPGDFTDPSEIPEDRRVTLARSRPRWVPAMEVRGEGLFLQLREDQIRAWMSRPEVRALDQAFRDAHRAFRIARKIANPDVGYPGLRYVLLHTLSHALLRQFSIECGYGAASLVERIYASDDPEEPMAGLLLYTAAADSEGTLGGLVALGEPRTLGRHLGRAMEDLALCASDPLCAEHHVGDDVLGLHGAACHACVFAAETSCERGNKYLDRSVLVDVIASSGFAFFEGAGS